MAKFKHSWQWHGDSLKVGDPDWVAEATEPRSALTILGPISVGLLVHTARGPQKAKSGDWIVDIAGEIYLLSEPAFGIMQ